MTSLGIPVIGLICLLLSASGVHAQTAPVALARVDPGELSWIKSAQTGSHSAFIVGEPSKPGTYVVRTRFVPGQRVEPHFHPDERIVVVLSGTVYFGYGDQFDESKMKALPAGSVWTEPSKQPHFAWAKDGEAVIQIVGHGPSSVTPVQSKQ